MILADGVIDFALALFDHCVYLGKLILGDGSDVAVFFPRLV